MGYCSGQTREGQHRDDVAFRLTKKAVISVPTASAFPGMIVSCENLEYTLLLSLVDGFPFDFSILATFKSSDKGQLFTAYSADGSLILSVRLGRRIVLSYKGGGDGRRDRVRFKLRLNPGK